MTAPTLPAMTDAEMRVVLITFAESEARKLGVDPTGLKVDEDLLLQVLDFAQAAAAARDAQWAARHNAWVDGIDKAMAAEVDKLQSEIENLHSVMVAAAEEIHEHWQAHCDEDGYGPANLMHRLEKGIPAEYAYKAGDFERLMKERDAAVARLDAAVRDERTKVDADLAEMLSVIDDYDCPSLESPTDFAISMDRGMKLARVKRIAIRARTKD